MVGGEQMKLHFGNLWRRRPCRGPSSNGLNWSAGVGGGRGHSSSGSARPIAAPQAQPLALRRGRTHRDRSPPAAILLWTHAALAHAGPPIEDGERCHVCDDPAVVEQLHIAWCRNCACALFLWRQLRAHGPGAKAHLTRHALEHAFRWERLVERMLSAPGSAIPTSPADWW